MRSRLSILSIAFAIGAAITLMLTVAASLAHDIGAELATRILSWPNTLLQGLVSPHNIGTMEKPFYEGTALNVLAYFASFPLSISVYSLVAYFLIRRRQSKAPHGKGSTASVEKS